MSSQIFDYAFNHLMEAEGGYVNDKYDRGGRTKYGISQKSYPELNIRKLTLKDAKAIYLRDYWKKAGCDKLPPRLALAVFDAAVNHGVKKSVVFLQQTIGVRADGVNGPVTQKAARKRDKKRTLIDLLTRRAEFYHYIVLSNSTQARFIKGWFKRLFKLQRFIFEVT